jgi:protoporphyrinogen oxidase
LSAALELGARGIEHRLFERERWVGGLSITQADSGFLFDRTGHLLHLRDPAVRARVFDWLEEEPLLIQRNSVIWLEGGYSRYPFQANTHGLPPEVAYRCLLGFVEAHFASPKTEPENFEEYCLLHFGRGMSEYFMLPYNQRLWGVPAREITTAWCDRFVPRPRLEDVIAGAVGLEDPKLGYNATFYYPRHGIGQLGEAMARRHGPVELGSAPLGIDWRHRRLHFPSETVDYGVLVSTVALPDLIALLQEPPAEVQNAARSLRAARLWYLDVALATPCQKPFHWVYVPESKYPFYRVGCYTNFSRATAPPGQAHLYVELVERQRPELGRLLPEVAGALVQMGLIAKPSDLCFARPRPIDCAYVLYDRAREPALQVLEPFLAEAGILSTGRYGGWNYSSMEDALIFGYEAAVRAQKLIR